MRRMQHGICFYTKKKKKEPQETYRNENGYMQTYFKLFSNNRWDHYKENSRLGAYLMLRLSGIRMSKLKLEIKDIIYLARSHFL